MTVRLDKWLWAARFYKTRGLCRQAVEGGKVRLNGNRAKPGKDVVPGDTIELRQGHDTRTIVVQALTAKRCGAPEAQKLYVETQKSLEARARAAALRKASGQNVPAGRPDKKQRRELKKLKENF